MGTADGVVRQSSLSSAFIFAGKIRRAGGNSAFLQSFPACDDYRCLPALRTVRYLAGEGEIEEK